MLDHRVMTFADLCKTRSYTKTAERLHMTQPAVTQHIQYLEKQFGVKLFSYIGRELKLTRQGVLLNDFATNVGTNLSKLHEHMAQTGDSALSLSVGTTENIGEYILPDIITDYLRDEQYSRIRFSVGSTDYLLELLKSGKINFAIVDGSFNKHDYVTNLLYVERAVVICAPDHPYAGRQIAFDRLLSETLLVRGEDTAPRQNVEQHLRERNLDLSNFKGYVEVGNLNVTKRFVQKGMGIAFIYHHAVKEDIDKGLLSFIDIPDLNMTREICFVYLKDDYYASEYLRFLDFCTTRVGRLLDGIIV